MDIALVEIMHRKENKEIAVEIKDLMLVRAASVKLHLVLIMAIVAGVCELLKIYAISHVAKL